MKARAAGKKGIHINRCWVLGAGCWVQRQCEFIEFPSLEGSGVGYWEGTLYIILVQNILYNNK